MKKIKIGVKLVSNSKNDRFSKKLNARNPSKIKGCKN
jgi:hypothetical protein